MATFHPELTTIFSALSDPTRLAVVERLALGAASVSELAQPFGLKGPSFLKHIKVLEAAGLIRTQKKGRVRTAQLEPDSLRWVEDWVARHRGEWERRLDDLGDFLEHGDN